MLGLSYFPIAADLYMNLWLSYFMPISEDITISSLHSEEKKQINSENTQVGDFGVYSLKETRFSVGLMNVSISISPVSKRYVIILLKA